MATYVLGISAFYHDSAACLLRDGDIVAAAQEERFSRRKHDSSFPISAIDFCLRHAGISIDEIAHVAFYDQPLLKFERLLHTYFAVAPRGWKSFRIALPLWLRGKLWIDDVIRQQTRFRGQIHYPQHHQSHAASAFYPSPFTRAAIVTVDGVGEWATASWGIGSDNRIELRSELRFPHSLGLLYSAFTYYTGFKVNSGEYKVMGLAPYGEPAYTQLILDNVLDLKEDGSFRLNMKYFNYCQGLTMTSEAFHDLFGGPPRLPETDITQRDMDLARSVQDVTEEVMRRMIRHARRQTGETNLCLAGGVALNCVANGKILLENIFERMWIQPASGDAGGALGAAQFVWHQMLGKQRTIDASGYDTQHGSYLGPSFDSSTIAVWADSHGLPYRRVDDQCVAAMTADLIAQGKVVGWLSGRMEFGPRALGARSILGDARNAGMQSVMNLKIKFRESFRPFAPSVLEEDAAEYFEINELSPYMLLVAPVRHERRTPPMAKQGDAWGIDQLLQVRSDIPAVTHIDYSARIQTVNQRDHPAYRRLLEEFKKRTGYSLLVNTSFNVRGEPIVCSPEDAYRCFMRTGMDALVMENLIFQKEDQPEFQEASDWREQYQLD